MEYIVKCLWELAVIAFRCEKYEDVPGILDEAAKLDRKIKRSIMEKRRNDGSHFTKDEHGHFTGSTGYASGSGGKSKIKNAFRKGVNCKSSKEIVDTVIEYHESLGDFTPVGMKKFLEGCGYEVKPLGGKSSLSGQSFEKGGGYRVTFGGDGYFQYHPEKGSHHDSKPYWKISNGERGKIRYDMDGKEF